MGHTKDRGAIVKAAGAAGVATALLMGGFGAFALWSDEQAVSGAGDIATGYLQLDEISAGSEWVLDNPQDGGDARVIDLDTYLASPGDVISTQLNVSGTVTGTDITAELQVDSSSVAFNDAIEAGNIAVELVSPTGQLQFVGTEEGYQFKRDVAVRVVFSADMTEGMSLEDAVSLSDLTLTLQQL